METMKPMKPMKRLREALEAVRLYLKMGGYPKKRDCLRLEEITGTRKWSENQMIRFIDRTLRESEDSNET